MFAWSRSKTYNLLRFTLSFHIAKFPPSLRGKFVCLLDTLVLATIIAEARAISRVDLQRLLEILHAGLSVSFRGVEVGRSVCPSGTPELVRPDPAGERIVAATTR